MSRLTNLDEMLYVLTMKGLNFFSNASDTVNIASYNKDAVIVNNNGDIVTLAASGPTFSLEKIKQKIEILR